MSAGDHLNNIQFSTAVSKDHDMGATYAHNGNVLDENGRRRIDNLIGHLSWGAFTPEPGEIGEVWVHPDHRRQGIATAMLHAARSAGGEPKHSTIRTEKGEAWARAQGAPPRQEVGSWKRLADIYPDPGHEEDYKRGLRNWRLGFED